MLHPLHVTPLPGFRLHLAYADGVAGEVDLSRLAGRGVFALWNEPGAFERVSLGGGGQVRWSEEVELCADALYLELTGQAAEDLFPQLAQAPLDA